jgi:hypothetical protein
MSCTLRCVSWNHRQRLEAWCLSKGNKPPTTNLESAPEHHHLHKCPCSPTFAPMPPSHLLVFDADTADYASASTPAPACHHPIPSSHPSIHPSIHQRPICISLSRQENCQVPSSPPSGSEPFRVVQTHGFNARQPFVASLSRVQSCTARRPSCFLTAPLSIVECTAIMSASAK